MVNHRDAILFDYRTADENRRLHMFLVYRDLRMVFMEMENDGSVPIEIADPIEKRPSAVKKIGNGLARLVMKRSLANDWQSGPARRND